MKRLEELMAIAVGSPEVLKAARAQSTLKRWPEAVGEFLAERSRPLSYDHGTLHVTTDGSAWAQEIRMRQSVIIHRLNEFAGEPLFTSIRVTLRPDRPL